MATKTGIIVSRLDQPWKGAKASAYLTTRKMVAFVCPTGTHNALDPADREVCKAEHDPYTTVQRIRKEREQTAENEAGEEIITGTEVYYVKKRTPNWEQVIVDISHDSGQTLARRLEQGWVYPEDLGYAPFCDYLNCAAQNPKHRTPVGTYHLRDEAALMMLQKGGKEGSTFGTAIFIDDPTSEDRRRIQLDEVAARIDR